MTHYLHLDNGHADYEEIIADCETEHQTHYPQSNLSINLKKDGAESLVKVSCDCPNWLSSQSWKDSAAILETNPSANDRVALVHGEDWVEEIED